MSRSRKDINMDISFLCIQVRIPDEYDCRKIMSVLRYIRVTLNLLLILRADRLSVIKWWVYASFAVNPDCKEYTGAVMSIGQGSIM